MTSEDFEVLLVCLGFGFGSLFWLFLFWFVFGGRK